jgi:hypothetical protein
VALANTSIAPGTSTTYSWSSANATSCSGSGALSGSKATSGGPVTTGVMNTAGTYNFTITCVNAVGGSASSTAILTVTSAAIVYCNGKTPCYGVTDLNSHVTATNCWAYNLDRVVNVTTFNNGYHKSRYGNILPSGFTGDCGNVNLQPFLVGKASIPGIGSHNHSSAVKTNTGTITGYFTGYYDGTKP